MTGNKISVDNGLLPELLVSQDGLAKLVQDVLNQVLEAQMEDHQRSDWACGWAEYVCLRWRESLDIF